MCCRFSSFFGLEGEALCLSMSCDHKRSLFLGSLRFSDFSAPQHPSAVQVEDLVLQLDLAPEPHLRASQAAGASTMC